MVSNDPIPMTSRLIPAALLSLALLGSGCSVTGSRESPINEVTRGSPTVLDLYRGKASPKDDEGAQTARTLTARTQTAQDRLRGASTARPIAAGDADTQRYWSALEPMRQRFVRVPNPDLVMVVYPHLARGTYPVPGYVTTFPMYEQTFYALPGEVEQDLQVGRALRPDAGATTAKSTR
ncbi:TIGR03751 family conjugal transfer lipoprotein [Acidovorax sp. SUPP1855]|uniref:TIGR03751 family conjugal transfer lipoprotein n=1 Tax=Acidovorax sp. SUPP1855 TaxID=431774 RepID=UPI0023DE1CF1|nr:TIGR03751 family conjugal transfer lipoprotein [Acidovorax sp. SUPP1855]GKS87282.1 TIGR03751 family conjugal transfer lipoprotein [Acidovorax sp. SUPP1855]